MNRKITGIIFLLFILVGINDVKAQAKTDS